MAAPKRLEPPKLKSEPLADVAWMTAQQELQTAQLLNGASHWSASVFHSHQAAEQTIKAVLLRTCGVTGEEFHGAQGHDLASLMAHLDSPLPVAELQRLSRAYLGTRYPAFPPQAAPTLPSAAFSSSDAHEALDQATRLLEWARGRAQVESSLLQLSAPTTDAMEEEDVETPCLRHAGSSIGLSDAVAKEAALRSAAEATAQETQLENQRLKELVEGLRKEADQAIEATQQVADEEKRWALEELRSGHEQEMAAMAAELKEARAKAGRLQSALHALTG